MPARSAAGSNETGEPAVVPTKGKGRGRGRGRGCGVEAAALAVVPAKGKGRGRGAAAVAAKDNGRGGAKAAAVPAKGGGRGRGGGRGHPELLTSAFMIVSSDAHAADGARKVVQPVVTRVTPTVELVAVPELRSARKSDLCHLKFSFRQPDGSRSGSLCANREILECTG